MKKIKPIFLFLTLNAVAILFYFIILTRLMGIESIPANLFSTGDSQEYYGYSIWISGNSDYCNPVRTFFYPFILFLTTNSIGSYGPWIIQFLFWIISCNLVLQTLLLLTGNRTLATIGFILCFTHLPLIGYSTHALTEITIFFLLSILLYTSAENIWQINKVGTLLKLLFIISLLAATKPVYQAVWYVFVLYFILFSFRSLKNISVILYFLLASSPVLVQKSITLITHDTLSSIQIADSNFKNYLYRKIKHSVDHGTINDFNSLPDSIHAMELKAVENISTHDALLYLVKHPKQTACTFLDNLEDNIGAGYPYIDTSKHITISKWAGFYNKVLMYLHIPFFLAWLIFIFQNRKGSKNPHDVFILFFGIILYYIYLTSGLVFWAGDRLIAPATSLWICCYFIFGHQLYNYIHCTKENGCKIEMT